MVIYLISCSRVVICMIICSGSSMDLGGGEGKGRRKEERGREGREEREEWEEEGEERKKKGRRGR